MISRSDNKITIQGNVTIDNVVKITQEGIALFDMHHQMEIDLSHLMKVDSSVVSMLLEWQRATKDYDKPLQYTGIPNSLEGLINLYGLSDLIPHANYLPQPD